jgi:tetratricopeptide (TPR) repeat protein
MAPPKSPPLLSAALIILRVVYGWTAKDLASAAGLHPSTISDYETGGLTRERLDFLAAIMGASPEVVELAIFAAGLFFARFLDLPAVLGSTTEDQRIADRALVLALRELFEDFLERMSLLVKNERIRQAHQLAGEDWERLKAQPPKLRPVLVEAAPEYQSWAFIVRLCEESAKRAAHDPGEALELARLAEQAARQQPQGEGKPWRMRLEGYATAFEANAFRVAGQLKVADQVFARAWILWRQGTDRAGLLAESRLLDLEASLRRDQGHFTKALSLLDQARELAAPSEAGRLFLKESATREQMGDFEGSIAALERAAGCIDAESQPRLSFGLRYNQAKNLCRLGRAENAEQLIPEIRELAERLRNDIDLLKTLGLEALVLAGQGRTAEAVASLEMVCRAFRQRPLPCDFALAGLDLVLLYREQGRWLEIQRLAKEMVAIFQKEGGHREAIAAVVLFQEAAAKEAVTVNLVYRLQDYLRQCRRSPAVAGKFAP